ncbi:MAG: flagellar basal-body rod protein FlgG [Rhodobacteraceae bacterium]|nr:flagellar basal-body rod protein FlgG [Paracoccaceae bacterium]
MRALKIAATGMDAQQTRVEVISNNIANMSTTAYQPRRAEFADLHYQQKEAAGAISSTSGTVLPTGVQLGLGVRMASVNMQIEQGAMAETGGDLDLAIEGRGYLEVELPSGDTAFTRDGSLKRSADGLIVTSAGYAVGGGITIPEDARRVEINGDGEVYAYFDGEVDGQLVGAFTLAAFANAKGLEAIGGNLFKETAASGAPVLGNPGIDGRGQVRQGFLEQSAVDVVSEITDLIEAQRGYEMNSKVVTAADQMLSATTQIR